MKIIMFTDLFKEAMGSLEVIDCVLIVGGALLITTLIARAFRTE